MASEENIKVAVRLRPFLPNLKEECDGRSKRIIQFDEISSSVCIQNPKDPSERHKFSFDSVLWSFDGFVEQPDGYFAPENKAVSEEIYCDQKQVYEDVGKEMVQNLWNGCNGTVFTFGEGKSGKSWTLLGLGSNKGLVPQSLTDLFKSVREKEKQFQQNGSSLEVRLSMAEVYNERVKDLLPSSSNSSMVSSKFKSSAKIREHTKRGFYVEGLRSVLVMNHEDIQQRLEEGLMNRAAFLTSINATSGYSMLYIVITLVQRIRNQRGDEVTKMSTLEFFDLPACEYKEQDSNEDCDFVGRDNGFDDNDDDYFLDDGSTSSVSKRYPNPNLRKNGIEVLSNCVDHLIEASIGKFTDMIPFYKHGLTKLMRNAFVGNTKTYMIATLSPSEASFKNSLFVLKLAEKVRMLTTRSVPNEEVTSKLIRELKSENDKIRKLISLGEFESNVDLSNRFARAAMLGPSEREGIKRKIVEDMKGQIRENEKEIRNLQQPFEERMKPFKTEKNDLGKKMENDRKSKCHLFNLNSDSQINGKIVHIIPLGTIDFGQNNSNQKGKENSHFINFTGPGIQDHHGTFTYNSKEGKFSIRPSGPNSKILVNETPIQFDTTLAHNDRIVLGGNQVWIYQNPKETWLEKFAIQEKIYYENVMEELALKSEVYRKFNSKGPMPDAIHKQLLDLIPNLEDFRSMSTDLNQNFTLEPILLQPVESLLQENNPDMSKSNSSFETLEIDKPTTTTSIPKPSLLIKVLNTTDGTFYYWSFDKFYERLESMRDSFAQYLDDGDVPLKEVGAFKERLDADMPIGYSLICLQPLAYMINIENPRVPILDYISFEEIGSVGVSIHFLEDSTGEKVNDKEVFIEGSEELLDGNLTILVSIKEVKDITLQFKDVYCTFKFLEEDKEITKYLDSKSSNFSAALSSKFERKFFIGPVTENTLNSMQTQTLILRFYGKQRAHKLLNLMGSIRGRENDLGLALTGNPFLLERTKAQLKIKEVAEERKQRRLNAMKELVSQTISFGEESIPVNVVKTVFEAKSQKLVDQSLDEHKELLAFVPEEPVKKELPPELKALKRFSEVCSVV